MRLASTQHRMLHKIRMTAAEMPNIVQHIGHVAASAAIGLAANR